MRGNLDKESSREVNLFCVSVLMHWIFFFFAFHGTIFRYKVVWNKSWNLFLNVQNNEMTGVLYISMKHMKKLHSVTSFSQISVVMLQSDPAVSRFADVTLNGKYDTLHLHST